MIAVFAIFYGKTKQCRLATLAQQTTFVYSVNTVRMGQQI